LPVAKKVLRNTQRPDREPTQPANNAVPPRNSIVPAQDGSGRDYLAIAERYASDVLKGRIKACRAVKQLVKRQRADRKKTHSKREGVFPYVWSDAHAIDICVFCEQLPLALGDAGLLRLRPAQVFLLTLWFGWRLRSDLHVRRFRFIHLEVARKFGKSTLTAAIALYGLVKEGEHGARVLVAATAGKQTEHIFATARYMAEGEYLQSLGVEVFKYAIVHEASNSKIEALNSRAHSLCARHAIVISRSTAS
jgi:phage terminase large subunit-like protein